MADSSMYSKSNINVAKLHLLLNYRCNMDLQGIVQIFYMGFCGKIVNNEGYICCR